MNANAQMFRRPRFIPALPARARAWLSILLGGACLGLPLFAWLQQKFQLDPRVVRLALLAAAGVSPCGCVLLGAAYVKELRREEEKWAGRQRRRGDAGDADAQ